jgi:hypothetical protein
VQASVRLVDRVVVQFGHSLGERDGCDVVDLTASQETALRVAADQPHSRIYLSTAGAVTFDPPDPPPPLTPEQQAEQTRFGQAVTHLRTTFEQPRTNTEAVASIDALTVILRRVVRELREGA